MQFLDDADVSFWDIGATGAKWAPSKIVLIIFKEFENSKKTLQQIWTIVKFLFATITDAFQFTIWIDFGTWKI